ncbi:hypothetical protein ES707_15008 [subsurface metagenome]
MQQSVCPVDVDAGWGVGLGKNLPPDVGGSRGQGFFRFSCLSRRPTGYRRQRGEQLIANRVPRNLTTSWHRFASCEPSARAGKLIERLTSNADLVGPAFDVSACQNGKNPEGVPQTKTLAVVCVVFLAVGVNGFLASVLMGSLPP